MNVNGNEIEFDKDGFMMKPALWNDEVAAAIAKEEGHRRDQRQALGGHPLHPQPLGGQRHRAGGAPALPGSRIKVREVYSLFRSGPARGACRIAGLPKPDGCV